MDAATDPDPLLTEDFAKVMTRDERRKLRKVEKHRPQFHFDTSHLRNGRKIGIAHIRDLVLYINDQAPKPGWILPENRSFISHTVVLLVPGLLPEHLGIEGVPLAATMPFPLTPGEASSSRTPSRIPTMEKLFTYGLPTRAPGDQRRLFSVVDTFLGCPLPESARKERERESRKAATLAKSEDLMPFIFLLTPNQMIDNDYRLPSYLSPSDSVMIPGLPLEQYPEDVKRYLRERASRSWDEEETAKNAIKQTPQGNGHLASSDDGWVQTPEASNPAVNGRYPILAIDCEMILTEAGKELARVSMVDFHSKSVLLDELVKPSAAVLDYLTAYSGITSERLATATHTFSSIQERLTELVTPTTILLGHSLECDLEVLKLRHPLCIDTSIIYKSLRGITYKPALKWLVQKWLGREIQASAEGHDSIEDATACIDLLKLKMVNGPDFGASPDYNESIFARINRSKKTSGDRRRTAFCDYSAKRSTYGAKASDVRQCTDDDEVLSAMSEGLGRGYDVVFGRFTELSNVQGWNGDQPRPDTDPSDPEAELIDILSAKPPEDKLESALERFNSRLAALHESMPRNTAFIVLNGHSEPLHLRDLHERRKKWERQVRSLGNTDAVPREDRWMAEDDRELETAAAKAREGMAFFCVK